MKQGMRHDGPDQITLGELVEAATAMLDAGAPRDAEVGMVRGDRGDQREPWPFLRGIFVEWEA